VFTSKVKDQYEAAETKKTTDLALAAAAKPQQAAANLALFVGARAIVDAEKEQQKTELEVAITHLRAERTYREVASSPGNSSTFPLAGGLNAPSRYSIAQEFDANVTLMRTQYSGLRDAQTAHAHAANVASLAAAQTYKVTHVDAAQATHTELLAVTTAALLQVAEAEGGIHLKAIAKAQEDLDNLNTQIAVPASMVAFFVRVQYDKSVTEFTHPINPEVTYGQWAHLSDAQKLTLTDEAEAADKALKMMKSLVEIKTAELETSIKIDDKQDKIRDNADKAKEKSDAALAAYNAADAQHKADIASAAAALAVALVVVTPDMQTLRDSATAIAGGDTLVTRESPDPTDAEKAAAVVNYAPYVANEQAIATLVAQIAADQTVYDAETSVPVKNAKDLSLLMKQYYDAAPDQEAKMVNDLQHFWNNRGAAMHAAAKTDELTAIGHSGKGLIYDADDGDPHMLYKSKATLDATLDAAIAAVGTAFSTELVAVRANLDIAVSGADKLRTLITSRLAAYDAAVAKAKSDIMDDIAQKRGAMAQSAMDQKNTEAAALVAHKANGLYGDEQTVVVQLQAAASNAAAALVAAGPHVTAAKDAIMQTLASTGRHGFSFSLSATNELTALETAHHDSTIALTSTHTSTIQQLNVIKSSAQIAKNNSAADVAASTAALKSAVDAAAIASTTFTHFLSTNDADGLDDLFEKNWKERTIDAIVGGLYDKMPQLRHAASSQPIGSSPGILGGAGSAAPPQVVTLSTNDLKSAPGLQHAVVGLSALALATESEIRIWF